VPKLSEGAAKPSTPWTWASKTRPATHVLRTMAKTPRDSPTPPRDYLVGRRDAL